MFSLCFCLSNELSILLWAFIAAERWFMMTQLCADKKMFASMNNTIKLRLLKNWSIFFNYLQQNFPFRILKDQRTITFGNKNFRDIQSDNVTSSFGVNLDLSALSTQLRCLSLNSIKSRIKLWNFYCVHVMIFWEVDRLALEQVVITVVLNNSGALTRPFHQTSCSNLASSCWLSSSHLQ